MDAPGYVGLPPGGGASVTDSTQLYFRWLCQLFDKLTELRVKSKAGKRALLAKFRRTFLPPRPSADLLFSFYRLLLPDVRRRRAVAAAGAASLLPPPQARV